jgi:hypothetical protein
MILSSLTLTTGSKLYKANISFSPNTTLILALIPQEKPMFSRPFILWPREKVSALMLTEMIQWGESVSRITCIASLPAGRPQG